MKKIMKVYGLLFCLFASTGCSWLFDDDGLFRDRSNDYREARVGEPLEIPERLDDESFDDIYAIPEISDRTALQGRFQIPRPESLTEEIDRDAVKINKLGDQQWILVNGTSGQVWPRLRSFFNLYKLSVQRADALNGILETAWLQPTGDNKLQERYQLRVEQGVQRGTSEVYVLQSDIRYEQGRWPESSNNPERETLMIEELAQFLANNSIEGSVSMLAQKAIDSTGRVTLEQPSGQAPFIRLELPLFRAWASTGRAVNKAGFEIDDLDRDQRLYYVRFQDKAKKEDKPGWFTRWFGGWFSASKAKEEKKPGIPYYIRVQEQNSQLVNIVIERQDGKAMAIGEAEELLKQIKRHLS